MKQEVITLTQHRDEPYAREGVIFMAEEDTKVAEQRTEEIREATQEENQQKEETKTITPEKIHEQVKQVVQRLEERVQDVLDKKAESSEEFRDALNKISLEEIEGFLRDIRNADRLAAAISPKLRAEIRQQEAQVAQILEENVTRRRVEEVDILRSESPDTLGAQVFAGFQKFLGVEGVTVREDASSQDIAIQHTDDGQQIVSVPKPTLENMIAVARQLNLGEFSSQTKENLLSFANELKVAAAMLDGTNRTVFSPEAIAVLYNAGYQLEQLASNPNAKQLKKVYTKEEVFGLLHDTSLQQQLTSPDFKHTRDKIFLDIFMGQHDLADASARTFYNVYFKRWRSKYPGLTQEDIHEQQKAYDTWLTSHQDEMLGFMHRFIERSLKSDGKAAGFVAEKAQQEVRPELMQHMLDPWRQLGKNAEGERYKTRQETARKLSKELKTAFPYGDPEGVGLRGVLEYVNNEFRPSTQAKLLDYIPSHLVDKLSTKDRDAVACIVAVGYEKEVLQETLGDGYLVLPEITGNHATLLVVDLENSNIFRVDPNVPTDAKLQDPSREGAVVRLDIDNPVDKALYDKVYDAISENYAEDFEDEVIDIYEVTEDGKKYLLPKFRDLKPSELKVSIQMTDANGKEHVIASGDQLITSVLLSNMAALGDNIYFQARNSENLRQLQLSAVDDALRLSSANFMAQKIKDKLTAHQSAKDLVEIKISQPEREKADEEILSINLTEHLVGLWTPSSGSWPDAPAGGPPPGVKSIIDKIDNSLGTIARTAVPPKTPDQVGLQDLPTDLLEKYIKDLGTEVDTLLNTASSTPSTDNDKKYTFGRNRLNELIIEYNNRRGGRDENSITSFNLTPHEQEIFTGGNAQAMDDFIEEQLLFFGSQLRPGFPIPQHALSLVNGKMEDIQKLLNSNPARQRDPDIEAIREKNERYLQILTLPVAVATDLESGNLQNIIQQGVQRANGMDSVGGHEVFLTLMELHDGKAHMLGEELGRRMEQLRQEKKRLGDRHETVITPSEYRALREKIAQQQFDAAIDGTGRYTEQRKDIREKISKNISDQVTAAFKERYKATHAGADPSQTEIDTYVASVVDNKTNDQLRKAILVDVNFANIMFIIDGRASAFGNRGEDERIFDPTSDAFVDSHWKNQVRYAIFSDAKRAVMEHLRRTRAEIYITKRWGADVWKAIERERIDEKDEHGKKIRSIRDQFVRLNGIELLAPTIDKYWENKFIRVRPMLYTLKKWKDQRQEQEYVGKKEQGIADGDAGEFGLFLRLLSADYLVRGGREFASRDPNDFDPLLRKIYEKYVGFDTVSGKVLRKDGKPFLDPPGKNVKSPDDWDNWDMDIKDMYKAKRVQFGLMKDVIAKFYPDELIKTFAYEPDYWTDKGGKQLDPRFVKFFTGDATSFLDGFITLTPKQRAEMAQKPGEPARDYSIRYSNLLAQARFKAFQDKFAPVIASIRNKNINGVGLVDVEIEVPDPDNPEKTIKKTIKVEKKGVKQIRQTDFGSELEEYDEFDRLLGKTDGSGKKAFREMMKGMTDMLIDDSSGTKTHAGDKFAEGLKGADSLIGRLAFDPMLDHVLRKSPLSLADIPYWMMYGKDIFGLEHPHDLSTELGGENQVGRWIEGLKDSSPGREALMQIAGGDPNQFEETMLKPLEEKIVPGIHSMVSGHLAGEVKASIGGDIIRMMIAEKAELFGAEGLPLKSSEMSKIYNNKTMRKISEAQAKTLFQSKYLNNLFNPANRAIMMERLFGGKWLKEKYRRKLRGFFKWLFAMFLITASQAFQTGTEAFQVELKAGG